MAGRVTRSQLSDQDDPLLDTRSQTAPHETDELRQLRQRVADLEAASARRGTSTAGTPTTPATPIPILEKARRSTKQPDPPVFSEADADPALDDWTLRIQDKLFLNGDHYQSDKEKTLYVIGRTAGTAAKHILAFRANDPDYFKTPDQVLRLLNNTMGDPYKRDNMRRAFKSLRQENQPFAAFYSDFRRYTSYLGTSEQDMIDELKDRVNMTLKSAICMLVTDFRTVDELSTILIRVDNNARQLAEEKAKQRALRETRPRRRSPDVYVPPQKRATSKEQPTHAIAASCASTPGLLVKPVTKPAEGDVRCWNCDGKGHYATDCPNPKKDAVRNIEEGHQTDESDNFRGRGDISEETSESEN